MLTVYGCPKAFSGHFATIQWNAIRSWALLRPRPRIVLLGNDEGVAAAAAQLGVEHRPEIPRNDLGTPLVSGIFEIIRQETTSPLAAYVNCDIILLQDFVEAIAVATTLRRFLMIGRRWNLDVKERMQFTAGWDIEMRKRVREAGILFSKYGIDYFVFPRDLFGQVPPFALGRTLWDTWLLLESTRRGARLVDATESVTAIHQNHDFPREWNITDVHSAGKWKGIESDRNRQIAGSMIGISSEDAALRIVDGRIRRRALPLRRRGQLFLQAHPRILAMWRVIKPLQNGIPA